MFVCLQCISFADLFEKLVFLVDMYYTLAQMLHVFCYNDFSCVGFIVLSLSFIEVKLAPRVEWSARLPTQHK